jgi:hypothetical protein
LCSCPLSRFETFGLDRKCQIIFTSIILSVRDRSKGHLTWFTRSSEMKNKVTQNYALFMHLFASSVPFSAPPPPRRHLTFKISKFCTIFAPFCTTSPDFCTTTPTETFYILHFIAVKLEIAFLFANFGDLFYD